ncbi:MAG: (4Fe-4S)-binding protein [Ruminococcaceae bacterium]|nr:(4Fe-4S)-binding protein [Oscillospiraceae bacterium]
MSLTKEQILSVKKRGFLLNKNTDCFSGRVVGVGGVFSSEDLKAISECAEKYGSSTVAFTSRLCAEIVGIHYDNIPLAEAFLKEHGLSFGGTGAKVRPITACKGTTCVYGNIDTRALAKRIHQKFYLDYGSVALPHKFKIGIGGCPNSCMKPSLNDVGIEGRLSFTLDSSKCRSCKVCSLAKACPMDAVELKEKAVINKNKCINCGVCTNKCPFGAVIDITPLCAVFVGGTWGKKRRMGTMLSRLVSEEEAITTLEKVFLWYRLHGYSKERLGSTVDRLGTELLEEELSDDRLLKARDEILNMELLEKPQ